MVLLSKQKNDLFEKLKPAMKCIDEAGSKIEQQISSVVNDFIEMQPFQEQFVNKPQNLE